MIAPARPRAWPSTDSTLRLPLSGAEDRHVSFPDSSLHDNRGRAPSPPSTSHIQHSYNYQLAQQLLTFIAQSLSGAC